MGFHWRMGAAAWQGTGFGAHSSEVDPGFTDVSSYDLFPLDKAPIVDGGHPPLGAAEDHRERLADVLVVRPPIPSRSEQGESTEVGGGVHEGGGGDRGAQIHTQ